MENITYSWSVLLDWLYEVFSRFAPIDTWNYAGLAFDIFCVFLAGALCLLPVWFVGRFIR